MLRIGHNLPRRPTCKSRTISTNQWSKDMFLHQRSLSELNPLILRLPNGNLPLRIHEGRWKMELTGWKYLIRLQFISINKFLTGFPDSSPYLTHFICSTRKPSIWMMLQSKQKPKPERKNFLKGFQQVEKGLHCLACTLPRPIYIYIYCSYFVWTRKEQRLQGPVSKLTTLTNASHMNMTLWDHRSSVWTKWSRINLMLTEIRIRSQCREDHWQIDRLIKEYDF
jgi:hypothetical protein